MPYKNGRPPGGPKIPQRDGLPVIAPLGRGTWSVACPVEQPDTRLRDQIIVSIGYPGERQANGTRLSIRIDNRCVTLDGPAVSALRQLLKKTNHDYA